MAMDSALGKLGVDLGVNTFSSALEDYNRQNLSPGTIYDIAKSVPTAGGGGFSGFPAILPTIMRAGGYGVWEGGYYADDLVRHFPKFKFLFKVHFSGFSALPFYCFVHRCDKPRVRYTHQDINYYNFRTRVLTGAVYEPLSMTLLDENLNSVNQFFTEYIEKRSGTGRGVYGIDKGFGPSSSTEPYTRGYSDTGAAITVEQIFANGTATNRFTFLNARIETFDFDDLSMDDGTGSLLTLTFSYDALTSETLSRELMYTWGETDLLRGGGTSGIANSHAQSLNEDGGVAPTSATGLNMTDGQSPVSGIRTDASKAFDALGSNLPRGLQGIVSEAVGAFVPKFKGSAADSLGTTLNAGIQNTLSSIVSGKNISFRGKNT